MKQPNTRVINLSTNYEDINAYNWSENVYNYKWAEYGKDNDYPNFLRTLYLSSPTNQAIIDNTINLATGEGVEVVEPEKNPISNKWVNENFPKDVVKKLIGDLKMYGYATIEIYSGSIVKYKEAIKFRFDCIDDNGNIKYVWFSNDWTNYNLKRNRPVKLPIYYEGCDEDVSVLVIQLDKKGFEYYAPVDYNAAINYITLESEISTFHLSNVKNGLFPGLMINLFGSEWSDEQMNEIERNVNKKWGGAKSAGRTMLNFATNKDDAATVETIEPSSLSEQYQFLTEECSNKILIGHGVTSPLLFGIRDTSGGLGNNADEMQKAFYLYYESKLKHYQNYILEGIKKVMTGNVMFAEVRFVTYNPFSVTDNTQQMSKITELDNLQILKDIENNSVKNENSIINETLFTNVNNDKLYKFIKASNNSNIISKKFELLSKKGYLFKASPYIKNTKDYYFLEVSVIKNNK